MGCCSSSESGGNRQAKGKGRELQISGPQDIELQLPRPRVDTRGVPKQAMDFDLDVSTITHACRLVARYLKSKGANLTVVCVGGVVSTMYLHSRPKTHDVDILGSHLTNDQRKLLDEAILYAEKNSPAPLGQEWMNTATTMWFSPDLHQQLTQKALKQNEVVFQEPGFKMVAASWDYAFCAKVQRLRSGPSPRPYDLLDAITYLRRWIDVSKRNMAPIPVSTLQERAALYGRETDQRFLLENVNAEYRRRYGQDGIVAG